MAETAAPSAGGVAPAAPEAHRVKELGLLRENATWAVETLRDAMNIAASEAPDHHPVAVRNPVASPPFIAAVLASPVLPGQWRDALLRSDSPRIDANLKPSMSLTAQPVRIWSLDAKDFNPAVYEKAPVPHLHFASLGQFVGLLSSVATWAEKEGAPPAPSVPASGGGAGLPISGSGQGSLEPVPDPTLPTGSGGSAGPRVPQAPAGAGGSGLAPDPSRPVEAPLAPSDPEVPPGDTLALIRAITERVPIGTSPPALRGASSAGAAVAATVDERLRALQAEGARAPLPLVGPAVPRLVTLLPSTARASETQLLIGADGRVTQRKEPQAYALDCPRFVLAAQQRELLLPPELRPGHAAHVKTMLRLWSQSAQYPSAALLRFDEALVERVVSGQAESFDLVLHNDLFLEHVVSAAVRRPNPANGFSSAGGDSQHCYAYANGFCDKGAACADRQGNPLPHKCPTCGREAADPDWRRCPHCAPAKSGGGGRGGKRGGGGRGGGPDGNAGGNKRGRGGGNGGGGRRSAPRDKDQ